MLPYLFPGLAIQFYDSCHTDGESSLPVLDKKHMEHSASAANAFSNCKYKVIDTAVEVWQTVQERTKEMQYRKVKSLKEYFNGYYLENAFKPIAPPCLLQVPSFIYSIHQSHRTLASVFYVPSLLYVPSQREETKAGVVPGKKWVLQELVGSFLSCTHRAAFYTTS